MEMGHITSDPRNMSESIVDHHIYVILVKTYLQIFEKKRKYYHVYVADIFAHESTMSQ